MGKNVLIIGASGGIGRAIAQQLGSHGHSLILHYYKNKEAIAELGQQLEQQTILMTVQCDLRKEEDVTKLVESIPFQIDAVIFAGGITYHGLLQDTENDVIDELIAIHVRAPIIITRDILKQMIQRRFGQIIFISSIWGNIGASHEVVYSSVKGAQNSFVKALAKEVGPSGITVNAVSPGWIDTRMNEHFTSSEQTSALDQIPLQRTGSPEEVANLVNFLLKEEASYIHGQIIPIDGGWSI